jgi:hypothetical protein
MIAELREKEQEIELIDLAIGMLSEQKRLLIDLKYLQDNKDVYVQGVLRKQHNIRSRDAYYRLKGDAVGKLSKMLGEAEA